MARTKTLAKKRPRPAPEPARLGPGLHAVTIEMRTEDAYRVRLPDGTRLPACLGDDVDTALAEDCLRTGRPMIAADTERGPTLLGALQTRLPVERDEDGRVAVRAKELRFVAERGLSIEAGSFALRVDAAGAARFEGNRMVIDMSELVRVLASRVELP
ncbi:Hypothetical protein A7982_06018 [Minicystis rosea]|nr:Hypothetical protein A7982_06018 [Minicystis rosea]